MILTPKQTNNLLEIINKNQTLAIGREFGLDYLTDYDKYLLEKYGVDLEQLYNPETDTIFTSFHFGLLSDALQAEKFIDDISYEDLFDYVQNGDYIPLTQPELLAIDNIKNQSLASLRGIGGKVFQDINNILINNSREDQESFLKKEAESAITKKKTVRKIANDIAHKTGDWSRDFDRIIQYVSQTAFETGKATSLQRQYGEDIYVYKEVYEGACKHCIRLYLTAGIGSEPKVFKLSELIANGSNIGRKVKDWLPTLDPIHPYCRCRLFYVSNEDNFDWNKEKKEFTVKLLETKGTEVRRARPKVRAIVGGKEVFI